MVGTWRPARDSLDTKGHDMIDMERFRETGDMDLPDPLTEYGEKVGELRAVRKTLQAIRRHTDDDDLANLLSIAVSAVIASIEYAEARTTEGEAQ